MKKYLMIGITLFLTSCVCISGPSFIQRWNQPINDPLALNTPTDDDVLGTFTQSEPVEDTTITPDHLRATDTILPPTPEPVCGGPPIMYILGVGVDTRDPLYLYGLADVIRIARVDFVTPKVTVLTIPRDLWVEFPDIIDKYADTVTHGKLNQAYLYGGSGMGYYDGPGGGPGLLARTIAQNYGLYVDHYAAINMLAFENMINALGGIDIYLDQDWDGRPVDDHTVDLGYFTAGQHHMGGEEALRFARIRKKYSEITRTDNQTLVMCAIKEKVLRPSVVGSIPSLISSVIGTVQTDLTPAQISQLVCLLPKLSNENLYFVRFPDEWLVQGREYDPNLGDTTFVWKISPDSIRQFMIDFSNDAIPADTSSGMSCP